MTSPPVEVADILTASAAAFFAACGDAVSSAKKRVVRYLTACRTARLGGHVEQCDACGHERNAYNSCRNRHCPKCQATACARWMDEQAEDLLPVEYFHVVFTVPTEIASIALQNKAVMYGILFRAAADTLKQIAEDPKHLGATIGFLAVLHTWSQKLLHHPHVHCIVPGGGLSADRERWISCKPGFFLPVKVLSRVFRGKFLDYTRRAFSLGQLSFQGGLADLNDPDRFGDHLKGVYTNDWVVYAKPPFGGPEQVLKYLARYTHRVAISNRRILSFEDGRVRFRYRAEARENKHKVMEVGGIEFVRRFLLHVLPRGFVRIRHFGLFANTHRRENLARCRELLGSSAVDLSSPSAATVDPGTVDLLDALPKCPVCKDGRMIPTAILLPAARTSPVTLEPQGIDSS